MCCGLLNGYKNLIKFQIRNPNFGLHKMRDLIYLCQYSKAIENSSDSPIAGNVTGQIIFLKLTRARAHTHSHARAHARTHSHAHTRTHTLTRAHTHSHTPTHSSHAVEGQSKAAMQWNNTLDVFNAYRMGKKNGSSLLDKVSIYALCYYYIITALLLQTHTNAM